MKHINTLLGQDAEFQYVKAGGTYNNYWVLRVKRPRPSYST
jgi:hypothetical protein